MGVVEGEREATETTGTEAAAEADAGVVGAVGVEAEGVVIGAGVAGAEGITGVGYCCPSFTLAITAISLSKNHINTCTCTNRLQHTSGHALQLRHREVIHVREYHDL